jgi:LysR family transcriptional regulator of gallate degradation
LIGQGLTPPAQTCEIVTFYLAEQMILHSDTIGLLTYSFDKLEALPSGLIPLAVKLPDNKIAIGLTHRKDQALTPAQSAFVTIMTADRNPRDA